MSVKVTGWVWELKIPSNEKLVLLAYADHAAHDGTSIYPAVAWVATKTGYSEREVQRVTRTLERKRLLVSDGTGPRGTNRWRCDIGGDNSSPVTSEGVSSAATGGDNLSPVTTAGVTSATPRDDIGKREGVTPVSPESSLTVIEPSTREGLSQTDREQAIGRADLKSASPTPRHAGAGMPSAMIENAGKPTYVNRDKIPEQYLRYADTYNEISGQEPTKRVLQDWLMTFAAWASEQIRPEHVRQAYKELGDRLTVTRPGSLTNTAVAVKAKGRSATSTVHDEALHQTQLLLAENDRHRARRTLPPPGLREKLHAHLEKQTVKPAA